MFGCATSGALFAIHMTRERALDDYFNVVSAIPKKKVSENTQNVLLGIFGPSRRLGVQLPLPNFTRRMTRWRALDLYFDLVSPVLENKVL